MAGFKIHGFDFNKLIEFASTAKGDVFLETPDGDVLNLKSRLTQLLGAVQRDRLGYCGGSHRDL